MLRSLFIAIFLTYSFYGNCQENSVNEDLQFLSSDEMKGRENGSDELLEAAKYISERFKEIGLSSPSFCEEYMQEIKLIQTQLLSKQLILNNYAIKEDDFMVLSQNEHVFKNDTNDLKVFLVGEHDDIMNTFSELVNYPRSYAVLVHPNHSKRFDRLKRYFRNDKMQVRRKDDYFSLWVKTAENNIDNIQLSSHNEVESIYIYNVVGELAVDDTSKRKWIYSAHYDHIGIVPNSKEDSIANGANDDASGVVAVIDLARKFSAGAKPEKSVYFVAFAGEELGLYGSRYMSSTIDLNEIEAMVNLEMIGEVNNDLGPESAYISGYDLSYLPAQMAENVNQDAFMFFPDPYPYQNLFKRSDNISFANYGIPAHSISTYNEDDERYHTVNDEIEYLDIDHIQSVIDAIYESSLPMLKLDYNPGRIDYKTKNDR